MGWEPVQPQGHQCPRPALWAMAFGVALDRSVIGRVWRCDDCGLRWQLVRRDPEGPLSWRPPPGELQDH